MKKWIDLIQENECEIKRVFNEAEEKIENIADKMKKSVNPVRMYLIVFIDDKGNIYIDSCTEFGSYDKIPEEVNILTITEIEITSDIIDGDLEMLFDDELRRIKWELSCM